MIALRPPEVRGVVVRSAAQVALALRAARAAGRSAPLPLLSPPGAARWLGAPLFLEMVAEGTRQATPEARPRLPLPLPRALPVLDCRGAPGLALAGLRGGVPVVVLEPECPAFGSVAAVAQALGTELWPSPPPALDLGPDRGEPYRTHLRLARWMKEEEPGG
ncbi:hypothetical protein E0493_02145 [Roseomonas sp. M0104]|uniref:Uncharacterized protein n=1 Tax=Teichococcus coralli TaxID=2545983 RepID=A0A845B9U1_9PROT|nr:hypothetical protein [Pseudoroseomonas coralli]MXP62152.1 hypothetical protein [Pseudoroseomonas coralli]